MVENSTINEIIKGISALIGGAFGVKILDFFIQRRKKKEEKNKEVLISYLMSINTMDSYMEKVTKETPADRFLILVGHDSGNIPNPMHPYYSKVLWQNLKNKNVKDTETLIRKFDDIKVDVPYISMIIEMLMVGSVKLKVSEMQDCFLKRAYDDDGNKRGFMILPDGVTVTPNGTFTTQKMKDGRNIWEFDGSTNYITISDHASW